MDLSEMRQILDLYAKAMTEQELSVNTRKKYQQDITAFLAFYKDKHVIDKDDVLKYKEYLIDNYKAATVNSYLTSINRFLRWIEHPELMVKTLKIQRQTNLENVLSCEEYQRLLELCQLNCKKKKYLIIRTLAATGIRVSELSQITCAAAACGVATIYCKGKHRKIFLPTELSEQLLEYCKSKNILSGAIFCRNSGRQAISTTYIWKMIKQIAATAGVNVQRAYPHSLRHLFAKVYMQKIGNIFELADLLGHASVETTRIYTTTSVAEKRRSVNMLGL